MARAQIIRVSLFVLLTSAITLIAISFFLKDSLGDKFLKALALRNPDVDLELSEQQILDLLVSSKLSPLSNTQAAVTEPVLPEGQLEPPDAFALGFGESKFIVDSRWATIRYLGESPAGAGLTGKQLNDAQAGALGRTNDTIPVVTIAETIHNMMEDYFAPLLKTLPRGAELLSRIKVQGAYFSPEFNLSQPSQTERDNAYVVGLQSLYVYSNSCFDRTQAPSCNPKGYSAGHDPSIIAHELGHVIFNHMRDGQSLEGWQWFAVNEGYADYFSASHTGNPVLGRIWRASRSSGTKYLRRLLDSPTLNDPSVAEEGHAFSLVWSSALWKARRRIEEKFNAGPQEFDRVILLSINFLGESTKTRLGDAAAAVLKAADVLGHSAWKDELRADFEAAEIDLSRGTILKPAGGVPIKKKMTTSSCGLVSRPTQTHEGSLAAYFILLPIAGIWSLRKRRGRNPVLVLILLTYFNQGCLLFGDNNQQKSSSHSNSILYRCDLRGLKDGTPVTQYQRRLSLIFSSPSSEAPRPSSEQIFVGDERYENAESALLLIVDREKMRIDQMRRRDGQLYQINLNQKYVSAEEAIAAQNARLSSIVIEGASRALLNQKQAAPKNTDSKIPSTLTFDYAGLNLSANSEIELIGPNAFSPVPKEIYVDGTLLCQIESITN